MALTFTKETLRAVQDALSIHEIVLSKHAAVSTPEGFHSAFLLTFNAKYCNLVEVLHGGSSLAGMPSIRYKTGLEITVLVQ